MTTLNDKNFSATVLESPRAWMVDFNATWCGPCLALKPIIEELDVDWSDKIDIGTLDVDDNIQTARKYGVLTIPTLIIFRNGRPVERINGLVSKMEIEKRIRVALHG